MIRPTRKPAPGKVRPAAAGDPGLKRRNLLRADGDLTGAVDAAIASAARKAGDHLVCRAGCSECCIGPFPINRLDVWRLREGLQELRERDPGRAAAIEARAREAVAALQNGFPGDPATGLLGGDEAAEDKFFEEHSERPCPVLDPATQTCDLYAHRPIFCRSYGPPVTFNGRDLPPCRLCFTTSSPDAVEACRVEPDRDGLERAILSRLKRDDGETRETTIAWAVAGSSDRNSA
ncbi:MAG TPA: YkgJ family cysteine cluster protein [Candidatus Polarisedimenticolia bacterium]|nr:YkgJ family cysteine cluster protein [Candidatus Polarisedimenticolia bacterium]